MNNIFITILNNALVASWIILAVIILRFLFKKIFKKVPKWINCLLWGLAGVKLLLPFGIESIFSLIPSAKPVPENIEYAQIPQIDSGITVVNTIINPVLENNFAAEEFSSVNPMQVVIGISSYVWIAGFIGLLIYAFVSYLLLKSKVKNAQGTDKRIYKCDMLESPFILGVFNPKIYIPATLEDDAYLCVIEHEKAHIKRGDFVWKPLGFLILSVYWFNPLCWVGYIMLCKDIEYACDEKVTKDKDKNWKARYCQALLNCSSQRKMVSACPVAFGEVSVKDRIKSVINYKKPAFWIVCISIVVCIVVGVCFLTSPKNNTYSIKVMMPIGFDYNQSDVEFSPLKRKITIMLDEGQDDTQIVLVPNEAKTETAYEPVTLTAGVPVTMDVEKGAWFEIGVMLDEEVKEEIQISFSITGIETRIASHPTVVTRPESQGEEISSGKDLTYEILTGDELLDYLASLPDDTDGLAQAGCFVIPNKGDCRGINNLSKFINSYNSGLSASVTIGQYTVEGDLILYYIAYDGEKVTLTKDTRRDKFAGNGDQIITESRNYFSLMNMNDEGGKIIFIHNDPEMTAEKVEKILASSSTNVQEEYGFYFIAFLTYDEPINETVDDIVTGSDVTYSKYTDELLFNFGGKYYMSDAYKEPAHGEGTPKGWYSLGGEGECIDPSYKDREAFVDGKLTDYDWLDNHSTKEKISCFTVGGYTCCMYKYTFDLVTATEIDLLQPGESSTSEYWVVFYTEGEGKPLYLKYFNCKYFTSEKAMESIAPGLAIITVDFSEEENMGVSYVENPFTHEYIVEGDMVFRYKKYLVGKDNNAAHSVQYIVLTNDEDITWEMVNKSLYSSNSADWLPGTIIIGMNVLE